MKINDIVKEIHETAKSKGWYDKERSDLEIHSLLHSEIAEATEEVRKGTPSIYGIFNPNLFDNKDMDNIIMEDLEMLEKLGLKPEGQQIELVDCLVRIFDYFGYKGWDLEQALKLKMKYNKLRDYRHGGKKF